MGHIQAYIGILWHTLAYFSILWHTLAHSGKLWHTLAFSGILWHTLAYSCILWHTLAYSGILWHTLAYSGILWHTLACSGILWHNQCIIRNCLRSVPLPCGQYMAIFSSVRSSYSHPDLLVTQQQHPHFFRSHRSSTLYFHFLSHYSYKKAILLYKGNHWTRCAGFMDDP